jgi:probable F420-dependent oxidoreductase
MQPADRKSARFTWRDGACNGHEQKEQTTVRKRIDRELKIGVGIPLTEHSPDPFRLGRMVEDRGFESLFLAEHTHIPVATRSPSPDGKPLTPEHSATFDPFVALAPVAVGTERLMIGTGIALVTQRDPVIMAKETATLDQISNGRLLLGVGAGWNLEELRTHGTDPSTRFDVMRERVEAIRRIWTEDEPSYQGKYVAFDRIWCWPKPVQKPHPPVLIGGNGPKVIDRVLAFGDEWMPLGVDESFVPRFDELQRRALEAGRDPVPITAGGMPTEPAHFDWLASVGVTRGIYWLPGGPSEAVEKELDKCVEAMEVYRRSGG